MDEGDATSRGMARRRNASSSSNWTSSLRQTRRQSATLSSTTIRKRPTTNFSRRVVVSCSLVLFLLLTSSLRWWYRFRTNQQQQQQQQQPLPMIRSPSFVRQQQQQQLLSRPDDANLLALLYPPGLMGGYRNQVIRFLAFVVHALNRNISQLLLPSLLWSTQVLVTNADEDDATEHWVPIPLDLLLDVDHWNSFAPRLPTLIDPTLLQSTIPCWEFPTLSNDPIPPETPWITQQVLQRGFLAPIANYSRQVALGQLQINPRKIDLLSQVQQDCPSSMLQVYGGGKGAGRLWNDYITMIQHKQQHDEEFPHAADALVLQALRPKQQWRELAMQCVTFHISESSTTTTSAITTTNTIRYAALHARVELEMMNHNCGKTMERNLTRLLLDHMTPFINDQLQDIQGVFVAVSRSGMEVNQGTDYQKFQVHADENLETLNRIVGSNNNNNNNRQGGAGLGPNHLAVFECGRQTMQDYYDAHSEDSIDYGSLLQSMLNFYIATEATAFVGVRGSSYSTDIWTTRYHQGKGDTNYEYTPHGIFPMDNGGLPPPHKNCK